MVALAPNLVEIVYALGMERCLVGVSDASDFPPAARSLPRVGGAMPDLERIVALRPDLVLATSAGNPPQAIEALRRAGLPVLLTEIHSLPDILGSIVRVGGALGAGGEARRLARSLSDRISAVARARRGRACPRALLLIWPSPAQAAGAGTFDADLLARAGAASVVGAPGWPILSAESLLALRPDVVVYSDGADTRGAFARALRSGPLAELAAVRQGRVVAIPEDWLDRPGPRTVDALELLARRLSEMFP